MPVYFVVTWSCFAAIDAAVHASTSPEDRCHIESGKRLIGSLRVTSKDY